MLYVRCLALYALSKPGPFALAMHAGAIAECFRDSDGNVRCRALEALGKREPMALAVQAGAIAERLMTLQQVAGS